jgi:hypothetical protein
MLCLIVSIGPFAVRQNNSQTTNEVAESNYNFNRRFFAFPAEILYGHI